jgi:hypothetical protein
VAERCEREPRSRAIGRKGKADGWDPPVSCPGRKGRRSITTDHDGGLGRSCGLVRVRGKKGKRGRGQLGLGCVGRWTGGPLGVLEDRFLDLNLVAPFKFKSHTI